MEEIPGAYPSLAEKDLLRWRKRPPGARPQLEEVSCGAGNLPGDFSVIAVKGRPATGSGQIQEFLYFDFAEFSA